MKEDPLVSIIIPFFKAEKFLAEAVASVFSQTYDRWELLLVDDGSTDLGTELAKWCAVLHPARVAYLEHPAHQHRGISASRNLGLARARGEYIGFLDADDVWFPQKLARQISLMRSEPNAGGIYGATQYWYSWSGNPEDQNRDYIQPHHIEADRLIEAPRLLEAFLRSKAAIPCINSVLARRELVRSVGGFEESFPGMYEDQVFYAKIGLRATVYVSNECWDRYRQHPESVCSMAARADQTRFDHVRYLTWLRGYLLEHGLEKTPVWQALERELRYCRQPTSLASLSRHLIRRSRKVLARLFPGPPPTFF